jgi:hypothetical protein
VRQALEHRVGVDAEIHEARDLVDAHRAELLDELEAPARRAEEATRLEVSTEGVLDDPIDVVLAEGPRVHAHAEGAPDSLHEIERAAEVVLEGRLHTRADARHVRIDVRVEHQRDVPAPRRA